jgi:hypothetical protein
MAAFQEIERTAYGAAKPVATDRQTTTELCLTEEVAEHRANTSELRSQVRPKTSTKISEEQVRSCPL